MSSDSQGSHVGGTRVAEGRGGGGCGFLCLYTSFHTVYMLCGFQNTQSSFSKK